MSLLETVCKFVDKVSSAVCNTPRRVITHYHGGLKNGERHGPGTLHTFYRSSKRIYTGEFKDGHESGLGSLTLTIAKRGLGEDRYITTTYYGTFNNGKEDGNGKWVETIEDTVCVYCGDFKNGKKHGQGTRSVTSKKGVMVEFYNGNFDNGKMNGDGTLTKWNMAGAEITHYSGKFNHGRAKGNGSLKIHVPTGWNTTNAGIQQIMYVGEFHNGKPHGPGLVTIWMGGGERTIEDNDGSVATQINTLL